MITNSLVTSSANVYAPQNPVGQRPVGQEDSSLRITTTKPVEQLSSSGKQQLRTREKHLSDNAAQIPTRGSERTIPDESENQDDDQLEQRDAESRAEQARQRAQEQEDRLEIRQLAARDREVRAHERAHTAVGGQYAGAATYEYDRGPNGVSYAISGEVPIDVSPEPTPQETIIKAQIVRRAALAPAEPSPQDRRVAAQATQLETQAERQLAIQNRREAEAVQRAQEENNEEGDEAPKRFSTTSENESRPGNASAGSSSLSSSQTLSSNDSGRATPTNTYVASRLLQSIANTAPNARGAGSILNQIA